MRMSVTRNLEMSVPVPRIIGSEVPSDDVGDNERKGNRPPWRPA